LAKLFAKDGYNLILVARGGARLKELAGELVKEFGISTKVIVKDLSDPRASDEIFKELQNSSLRVDILVNNAGFGGWGFFSETDLCSELQMIQLNVVSLTHLTKLFLKDMVKNKYGKILNVASTAVFQPGPLMAVYYATKAYVLSFSEAIANELKGTGVTVTVLCPGPTRSGFQERADIENVKLIRKGVVMDSAAVARIGYSALMRNKTVEVAGFQNKILAASVRFTPRSLVTTLVRKAQER